MSLNIQEFRRKEFRIEAVRVDPDNIDQVASWCKGKITSSTNSTTGAVDDIYIQVDVKRPQNERQTRAYFGDWVLKAGTGFKVYRHKAFWKDFERVDENTRNVFHNSTNKDPEEVVVEAVPGVNNVFTTSVNLEDLPVEERIAILDELDVLTEDQKRVRDALLEEETPTPTSRREYENRAPLFTDGEYQAMETKLLEAEK